MDKNSCTFTWTLENVGQFSECETGMHSPRFNLDDQKIYGLNLIFFPKGLQHSNFTSLYLTMLNDVHLGEIELDFELSLIGSDGSTLFAQKVINQTLKRNSFHGLRNYISRDEIFTQHKSILLPDDTLTLRCQMWKSKGEFLRSSEFFCRTLMQTERLSFLWNIPNASTLKIGDRVRFPIRALLGKSPSMHLNLFLTGGSNEDEMIQFEMITTLSNIIDKVSCALCLLDSDGTSVNLFNDETWFYFLKAGQTWKLPICLPKRKLTKDRTRYIPNDTLNLKCELTMSFSKVIEYGKCVPEYAIKRPDEKFFYDHKVTNPRYGKLHEEKSSDNSDSLKEAFKLIFREELFSDMKLQTSSKTFSVHKSIMGARSPVFKAMFSAGTQKECVDIPDVDSDTMQRMLLYMYTDTLEDLPWEDASKLYVAADKYEVMGLKDKCSSILKRKLSSTNACGLLVVADTHYDDDLKTTVQNFISKRAEEITSSDAWASFQMNHSMLAAKTLRSVYLMKKCI